MCKTIRCVILIQQGIFVLITKAAEVVVARIPFACLNLPIILPAAEGAVAQVEVEYQTIILQPVAGVMEDVQHYVILLLLLKEVLVDQEVIIRHNAPAGISIVLRT
jgi:hypothetical protein